MCDALQRSLEAMCARAQVEAVLNDRTWQVAIRGLGDPSFVSSAEARSRAALWDANGQGRLAERFRAAASAAERRRSGRITGIIGLGATVGMAAVGWFVLMGEPTKVTLHTEGPVHEPDAGAPLAAAPTAETAAPSDAASPQSAAAPASSTDPTADAVAAAPPVSAEAAVPELAPSESARPTEEARIEPPGPQRAGAVEEGSSEPASLQAFPTMVAIPGGSFAMGGSEASELPVHPVTIKPFALSKYPVTVRQWQQCVAAKACDYVPDGDDDAPVSNVSFDDTQQYLAWLSHVTQTRFRLPSEAEWEYAARAGYKTKYWWGDQMRTGMADCKGCNEARDARQPMKVGSFAANPFGLHDMGGGVDQWVADSWHKTYQGAPTDGSAWLDASGFGRVIRSGSWKNDASYVRAASRDHYDARVRYPTHGFRVALSP
jgi:formylglycine-generating enzyme required for sulfatase activity